ncbi:replicative DNA helicase loader DnaB [Paenibacillus taihuensis]|uniref:Replicative DNA helicase loader DnaB n=1 Tax=Paenibacillus taihuensis TaxID=1156355 RepID=A0A3D9SJ71_9BACL|nr:helicase DnaB [Paenibacillus taihuensis]REE92913.1 replicative DNA helicase loader DnaB [Paenibacillus taihuensis]
MRIGNLHQFTEHHRYYTFRDFSLSAVDRKMIGLIYQPMIGAFATGLYQLLYQQTADDRVGYSELEPQRKLLLGLGLEMGERSRQELVNHASRLEAVGLLQVSKLGVSDNDDVVYEYELFKPLTPDEFFGSPHLTMLLRDKVGKHSVIALRECFYSKEDDELASAELQRENITVPFYELFRLNTQGIDLELEQALTEVAPARQPAPKPQQLETAGIQYGDIIMRFPRNSANRSYVERLRGDNEAIAQLNYVAYKYNLDAADLSRLLDEDNIFTSKGELLIDELQLRANQMYRQDRKRSDERQRMYGRMNAAKAESQAADDGSDDMPDEVAVQAEFYVDVPAQLAGRCDIHQYNMLMRNEPHTRFIARFFPGAVPEWLIRVFEVIDHNYRLQGAVINVLIHYVLGMNDAQRVTKAFIDTVASNMLMKGIDSYEKAVGYVREQVKVEADKVQRREGGAAAASSAAPRSGRGGSQRGGSARKPAIPIMPEAPSGSPLSAEEMEEIRRMARKLDGKTT